MRSFPLIAAAALTTTALTPVPAVAVAVAAVAAVDYCLDSSWFDSRADQLSTTDGTIWFVLRGPDCTDGGTITLTSPGGAVHVAPFTGWDLGDANHGPASYGQFTVPLATGAGTWRLTALSHGGVTVAVDPAIVIPVYRASSIQLDGDPFVVPPGDRLVVSGVLGRYTPAGTITPYGAGRRVNVIAREAQHLDTRVTGSGLTDASGRFRIPISPVASSQLEVYSSAVSPVVNVGGLMLLQRRVQLTYANPEPAQLTPTIVQGIAWPAGARVTVDRYYEQYGRWITMASGRSGATGRVSITDRSRDVGAQRMRIVVPSTDGGPGAVREFTRVVKYATAIDGFTGPTTATVIRPGTKMSSYGHLKIRRNDITSGYAGQRVEIQTRPRGTTTAYRTVATATTAGATGYYYANWTVRSDVDVRVQFLSVDADVKNVWKYVRVVDVR